MKKLIIILILVFSSIAVIAQSPYKTVLVGKTLVPFDEFRFDSLAKNMGNYQIFTKASAYYVDSVKIPLPRPAFFFYFHPSPAKKP